VINPKEYLQGKPVVGTLLRVQDRFGEIQGTALANGIALQILLSLVPLLLVAIAITGFLAEGKADFTDDVIDALGLTGDAADNLATAIDNAQDSRRAATAFGLVGLFWTGLAVVAAFQRAVDKAWQTKSEGIRDKGRAVLWLIGAVLIFVASFALSTVLNFLPAFFAPISIVVGLAVNVGLFLWTFTELGRLPVGWRSMLPGAVVGAAGFEILKLIGSLYVPRLVANSSALYGSLGIFIAILVWLAFFGRLFVYGAVVNVLRWESEHGTLEVPIEAPRVADAIALEADRAGAITERLEPASPDGSA
jgi:membrane protein